MSGDSTPQRQGGRPPACTALPGWREPREVLRLFADDPMPALLMSGAGDRSPGEIGRWSFLCADPFEVISWSLGDAGDPFSRLEAAVSRHRLSPLTGIPFCGGAVGYIAYEAGRVVERLVPRRTGERPASRPPVPHCLFGLYGWVIVWDHQERRWGVVATGLPEEGEARVRRAASDTARVAARIAGKIPGAGPAGDDGGRAPLVPAPILASSMSARQYEDAVRAARELIGAGDLYQVNLSQQLSFRVTNPPLDLFDALARHSPAPFSAYLTAGAVTILSASPERFVRVRGRHVESRPIKGTRPRGATPDADQRLCDELRGSAKDRAENVMIVDLVRNDLGRVCQPGSVTVPVLCGLESYASVHHLVSTVSGTLRADAGPDALLRALFPPGSMTGAPKVRAMERIEALEPVPRGPFAGAIGYLSFSGDLDLSVVIRTLLVEGETAWMHVGGGVVADSDPAAEYSETLDKAASVRRALAAAAGRR